jgi:hypothetical protein
MSDRRLARRQQRIVAARRPADATATSPATARAAALALVPAEDGEQRAGVSAATPSAKKARGSPSRAGAAPATPGRSDPPSATGRGALSETTVARAALCRATEEAQFAAHFDHALLESLLSAAEADLKRLKDAKKAVSSCSGACEGACAAAGRLCARLVAHRPRRTRCRPRWPRSACAAR